MEKRTWVLLVVIVIALGAWSILRPKPTSINDPNWDCPTGAKFNT